MTREEAVKRIKEIQNLYVFTPTINEALDLAIEALREPTLVRCKDCKHYNPPHIEYNDGTRKDYPDEFVTADIGVNVGGKCENSTTTMRTCCLAHDREDPDDFEELVIFRQPTEYCSFGEKAEKHQLSGETSTISEKESVEGDAESATTTDCISRQQAINAIEELPNAYNGWSDTYDKAYIIGVLEEVPPVTPTERTGEWVDMSDGGRIKYIWYEKYMCNKCGERGTSAWSFCPNCGAKMTKGGDTE